MYTALPPAPTYTHTPIGSGLPVCLVRPFMRHAALR